MQTPTQDVNKSVDCITESGTDDPEPEWKLNKHLKPVFANLNSVRSLIVTLNREGQIVSFNKACEQTTGYSFNEVKGKHIWDVFLLPQEVESFKAVYENLKAGSCSEYNYESCWVTKDGTRRRIAWSNTALLNNEGAVEHIICTGIDISEYESWAKELNQQNQRTELVARIALKIRQSLQLEEILQTTVTEVRNLLQADRVLLYRLWPDGTRSAVTEAVVPGWEALLGQTFEREVLPQEYHQLYACGQVQAIDNVETSDISPCLVEFLQQFGVKAKLVVPILLKEELWGLLIAHQCGSIRQWTSCEIELLKQLANQIGIALAQAQNQEHLEELVAQRTAKLTLTLERLQQQIIERQRAEEALRQWTVREQALSQVVQAIRNSLDLETIFSTAVEEIGKLLQVDRVVIVQYLPERKIWLNLADYRATPDLPVALGLEIPDESNPIAAKLKRSEVVLIDNANQCEDEINQNFAQTYPGAWLLIPLHFGSSVWGSLSFLVENRPYPWQDSEVQLSLAVGEQLAIAIQQAELYKQSHTATVKATEQATKLKNEIAERKQTEEELRQSEARFRELAQKEALQNRLASQIRRSLDLNTILETAVHEIRNLLQIDRCFFLWYRPNAVPPSWEVIQEAKTSTFPSLIGHCIPVTTFGPLTARIFNKEITRVDSARNLSDPVERKLFFSIGYTALLALPIHTTYGEIGVVSCANSSGSRPWLDSEVELLGAVADQLAIAIDQAQLLHQSRAAEKAAQEQATQLELALRQLQQAQAQLVQSEKMSSLGQLVAGIAHEINNPVGFIYSNLTYINQYVEDLLNLIQGYQQCYPQPAEAIQALAEEIDLDFIREDLPKIFKSMKMGSQRISQIVLSLRNFSRLDEAEMKWVDIHSGLDNTLLILAHRLKAKKPDYPDIQIIKDYGDLPKVQCYAGQLNQVFMNILSNAIEAIDEYNKERTPSDIKNCPSTIWICTEVLADSNQVVILIGDNGQGMTPEVCRKLFEPFFTTKPVGSGTGLGMSISYQIVVEKHQGQVECISAPGHGTAFLIYVPIHQSKGLPSQDGG